MILEKTAKYQHNPAMPSRSFVITRRNIFRDQRQRHAVVKRMLSQEPIGQHRHEFTEIAVILSGSGIHVTGEVRHEVSSGDVLVLDSRRTHGYEQTRNLNLANIIIRSDALSRIRRGLDKRAGFHALFRLESVSWRRSEYTRRLHLSPVELEQIQEWISRLEEETSPGSRGGRVLEDAYLTLILDALARKFERSVIPESRTDGRLHLDARLGRLLAWVEKNLERPLSVGELARQAKMSERTFHRLFRLALGMSPMAYVIQARIAKATARLSQMETGESITALASVCGFDDSNYFSRCFRQHTGMTPREYQKRLRKKAGDNFVIESMTRPHSSDSGR